MCVCVCVLSLCVCVCVCVWLCVCGMCVSVCGPVHGHGTVSKVVGWSSRVGAVHWYLVIVGSKSVAMCVHIGE